MQNEESWIAQRIAEGLAHVCDCGAVLGATDRELLPKVIEEHQHVCSKRERATWSCPKCGGTDPSMHCNVVVAAADVVTMISPADVEMFSAADVEEMIEADKLAAQIGNKLVQGWRHQQHPNETARVTSVFEDLESALREGATLDIAGWPIHAVMELNNGERYAEASGSSLCDVLVNLAKQWAEGKPKPPPVPPRCEACNVLLISTWSRKHGNTHLDITHGAPICLSWARDPNACVPADAAPRFAAIEALR